MQRALTARLVGRQAERELKDYLTAHLPRWQAPASLANWPARAARLRQAVLDRFFRGHDPGLLDLEPRWELVGELQPSPLYRVRKLRYEGYPGMWIPALLYEPTDLSHPVPAVLNPNGHHAGGKAMDYKQARCINLAKRGLLALSPEFIGMGELRADAEHNRLAHLDLMGVAGVAVFYLAIKRALDVLLAQPATDAERVVMTGLSGGGWQTAVLAALDPRIGYVVPVAGHSPAWQRLHHPGDIGDVEQIPSDLCTAADYDALTALFAPRPTLLIYNHDDDCCFRTQRTRRSVYQPVKPLYARLGAAADLGFHDNRDPGTHNYDADNRTQFYRFLHHYFGLQGPVTDLPWESELYSEQELRVGLPPDNATLLSLSQQLAHRASSRPPAAPTGGARGRRRRLAAILHLPSLKVTGERQPRATAMRGGLTIGQQVLTVGGCWSVPVTTLAARTATGTAVLIGDGGRAAAGPRALPALLAGQRVIAADLLGSGELSTTWQYHMLLAGAGQRSLGIQAGQLLAVLHWCRDRFPGEPVHLYAAGQIASVVGLVVAALAPGDLDSLTTEGLLDSLRRLIDWPVPYANAAPLFCFGLLAEFDIDDLIGLSAPILLADAGRGPLRPRAQ